ncbi:MAG: DUF1214 domain-containing protein [Beijerinckiaceae bacterium]
MSGKPAVSETRLIIGALAALIAGLLGGVALTALLLRPEYSPGSVRLGPWTHWTSAGAPASDPYATALHAIRGDLPLAPAEGFAIAAAIDSEGARLRTSCSYEIASPFPPSRAWTLAAYDPRGSLLVGPVGRSSITSAEVVGDGEPPRILIGPDPLPGNWLPVLPGGFLVIAMRFYDAPMSMAGGVGASRLPNVRRLRCRE